jgi:hypothetical protein
VEHTQEIDADSGWPSGGVTDAALKAWLSAVAAVRPGSGLRDPMQLRSAILFIAATPAARRSEFAAEILRRKRPRQHTQAAAA